MVVHLASGANQTRLLRVLRHDKPRVDGNTVSTNARAWLEDIDARVAVREANQLPDVNPLIGADKRQLVGKGDVHIAEAVFRQFAHLGGTGVSHHAFTFEEDVIEFTGTRGAYRRHSANHAIVFNQFHHHLPWQHALRAIGDIDVRLLTRLLREGQVRTHLGQPTGHQLGCAHRGGGFEDHQRPFLQHRRNRARCRFDVNHIRLMVALERRWHGNQIGICRFRRGGGA